MRDPHSETAEGVQVKQDEKEKREKIGNKHHGCSTELSVDIRRGRESGSHIYSHNLEKQRDTVIPFAKMVGICFG